MMFDGNSQEEYLQPEVKQPLSKKPQTNHDQPIGINGGKKFLLYSIILIFLSVLLIIYHYQEKISILELTIRRQRIKNNYLENTKIKNIEQRLQKMYRPSYLTPELQKISSRRVQKEGLIRIPEGSVSAIKYLIFDDQNRGIDEVLYDSAQRLDRKRYYQQRNKFLQGKGQFESISLIKYNMIIDSKQIIQQQQQQRQQYERINKLHHLQQLQYQIPICAVVTGYNNNDQFRIQLNLNSIFTQNYSNYFVVIINDASTDASDQLYRKYINFYNINPQRYVYIENEIRKTALENIYHSTHTYCSIDSVVANIDGDDELIGKNVFKIYNAEYQRQHAGVLYSSYHEYQHGVKVRSQQASEYTRYQQENHLYRKVIRRFAQLRTFRTDLFRKIKKENLQDEKGQFYRFGYDQSFYFKVIQLSCGRAHVIPGFHYLYKTNTGLNDYDIDPEKQLEIDKIARGVDYECDQDFNKQMKALEKKT